MKDLERALDELQKRGLIARSEAGGSVTYSADSLVAREIAEWMLIHPEEKLDVTSELLSREMGAWYAASFERLADQPGAEASEKAAAEMRLAIQCFLEAQSFGELSALAGRLISGTREPELMGQVVDDLTAAGVPVIFADYRLRRLIGVGELSFVFEAERADNGLPVAVKVLRGRWPNDESDVLRFLDEAKVSARVRHPNVVEVFDAGHVEGTRFVAMELLRGRSLERRWRAKGRRFPLKRVLEIAMNVLGVLAAAHEKSILHGGIRPSTIFITSDGLVKVLDFGFDSLTRTAHIGPPSIDGSPAPSFLAPEQINDELPDPRTDLWSLGSTILALLSGQPADSARPSPIASLLPGCPRPVVAVLDRALRVPREERWQSAKEMWEAIGAIFSELPDPEERVSTPAPSVAPIVDTEPSGPLSERVALEPQQNEREVIPEVSAEAVEAEPEPVEEPAAPSPENLNPRPAERIPVSASRPSAPTPGLRKPFLVLAAVAIVASTVALTLRIASRSNAQAPAPIASGSAQSAPSLAPSLSASGQPSIAASNPEPTSSDSATEPSPVTTGNTPLSAGDKSNGDRCDAATECKSGQCVDGVCCASACTGTCVACNLKSFLGTCAEIPFGYDPDKECGTNKTCDGDGSCGGQKSIGKRCKAGRECESSFCVRGICCATECRGTDGNCSSGTCRRSLLIE